MLDIHSDQPVYLECPELIVPERKSVRGVAPKLLQATTESIGVSSYMNKLKACDWQKLHIRNSAKGKLTGLFHFAKVHIWNKGSNRVEPRNLVIRKMRTGKKNVDIKYSFTNANFDQYTPEALAYMQSQRCFLESCIKESKYILGIDQFQTLNGWHGNIK